MSTLEHDMQADPVLLALLVNCLGIVDQDLTAHAVRVAPLVFATLDRLPYVTQSDRALAQATALLHDAGKAAIPAGILMKPSALTPEETAIVRRHPAIGANLVADTIGNYRLASAIRHHHEWWNGKGYPSGLAGERIPVLSRIVGVADAFDAMTTERPYRSARDVSSALEELSRCAGTQFDPAAVQAFTTAITVDCSDMAHRATA